MGLAAGLLLLAAGSDAPPLGHPALVPFLAPFVLAAWAYAVSMAAHGSRGALVALAGHAAVGGLLFGGAHLAACAPGLACPPQDLAVQALTALVGGITLVATLGEVRRRRGPLHGGTAAFLLAPLALAALLYLAAGLA